MTHKRDGEIQTQSSKRFLYERPQSHFITRIQNKEQVTIPGIRMHWKSMLIFIFVVTKLLKQGNDS